MNTLTMLTARQEAKQKGLYMRTCRALEADTALGRALAEECIMLGPAETPVHIAANISSSARPTLP